ncbi:hypothetical protein HZH68_012231 [Vespula germanica]|uniref:Uncharacterized protein n=1 Tax=Vespula germanica TaxID=30212 RepID=A0A834JJQ6_VESGE|nr:hypothetical protein HZH68_012231 [Vespula germanica]
MSGMLRPRHALIGDGLRRPTTAAYARTQLGKCGGSWVVPEYGFLARCRVVALLQATVIRAVLPPTSTTTTTQGGILQVARQSSRLVVVMSCWSVETTTNGDDSTVLKEEKAGKGCPQS